jgi:hypothetical protein
MASHMDTQKIKIIGFFFGSRLYWQFEFRILLFTVGTRWRSGWGTALQTGMSRVRFPMVSLDFFRSHYGPGVDSASNRNEY